jgi:hypothetical protein
MGLQRRTRTVLAGILTVAAIAGATMVAYGDPAPSLPPLRAEELVASMIDRAERSGPISGVLATHVDVGLPSIPAGAPPPEDPTMRAIDAVNGDRRTRLWASRDGLRMALLLPTSELGWFVSRTSGRLEAWAWDSQTFTAAHLGPVAVPDASMAPGGAAVAHLLDPLELARRSLQAIGPTTRVVVGESHRVAGRDAYRLVLLPRSVETLVGRIEISVDAQHRVPLGVVVFAKEADSPALSVAFSSVSFDPIDPATYRFSPPNGASIREVSPVSGPHGDPPGPRSDAGPAAADGTEQIRLFGRGWEAVVAVRLPARAPDDLEELRVLLPISGSLFSVRLVERQLGGWLLVGAVPQARLASLERELP